MGAIVYSTVYSGADQSKHQSSASLAFVWGIHRGQVNSPHKLPVTRKMFPFDDIIMKSTTVVWYHKFHVSHSTTLTGQRQTRKSVSLICSHINSDKIALGHTDYCCHFQFIYIWNTLYYIEHFIYSQCQVVDMVLYYGLWSFKISKIFAISTFLDTYYHCKNLYIIVSNCPLYFDSYFTVGSNENTATLDQTTAWQHTNDRACPYSILTTHRQSFCKIS